MTQPFHRLFEPLLPPGTVRDWPDAERILRGFYQAMWQLGGATETVDVDTSGVSGKLKTLTIRQGLIVDFTLEP